MQPTCNNSRYNAIRCGGAITSNNTARGHLLLLICSNLQDNIRNASASVFADCLDRVMSVIVCGYQRGGSSGMRCPGETARAPRRLLGITWACEFPQLNASPFLFSADCHTTSTLTPPRGGGGQRRCNRFSTPTHPLTQNFFQKRGHFLMQATCIYWRNSTHFPRPLPNGGGRRPHPAKSRQPQHKTQNPHDNAKLQSRS